MSFADYVSTVPGMAGCGCKQATPGLGAIVQGPGGMIDQDTGRTVQPFQDPLGMATGQLWVDPVTGAVMGQDGRIVTNVMTDSRDSAGQAIARFLAVPGQVTQAIGISPAEAVRRGYAVYQGGSPEGLFAPSQPVPASPSIGLGTIVLGIGAVAAVGLAPGVASRKAA